MRLRATAYIVPVRFMTARERGIRPDLLWRHDEHVDTWRRWVCVWGKARTRGEWFGLFGICRGTRASHPAARITRLLHYSKTAAFELAVSFAPAQPVFGNARARRVGGKKGGRGRLGEDLFFPEGVGVWISASVWPFFVVFAVWDPVAVMLPLSSFWSPIELVRSILLDIWCHSLGLITVL